MLTWLADVLRAEGCRVKEEDGWKQRQRPTGGELRPVGIINHHSAGRADLGTVIKGRPPSDPHPLPGPLANLYVAKDGTVHVVAAGTANHAGAGAREVFDRAKRDQAPRGDAKALGLEDQEAIGSSSWVGIEVENLGNGKDPYPNVQIQALVLANAAICRHQKWTAARCVHHREWTRRKIDMSHRGPLRDEIAVRLRGGAGLPPPVPAFPGPLQLDATGPAVTEVQHNLNRFLPPAERIPENGRFDARTRDTLSKWQERRLIPKDNRGKVGPGTWQMLHAPNFSQTLKLDSTGTAVRQLKVALNQFSGNDLDTTKDRFDTETHDAVMNWQRHRGQRSAAGVDGVVDMLTWFWIHTPSGHPPELHPG
jgi:N-acetyl-anhydromuramyl-L-alanine amidase AmpD